MSRLENQDARFRSSGTDDWQQGNARSHDYTALPPHLIRLLPWPALVNALSILHFLFRLGFGAAVLREARRVALLRALAPRPALLLLDEPLAHLDPETPGLVRRLIEQETADFHPTVLVTAHGPELFPGTLETLPVGAEPDRLTPGGATA